MRHYISCIALASILVTSCKKELKPQDSSPVTDNPVAEVTPTQTMEQPGSFMAQNANTTATAATGLNPAHGQPGHRCDIAVGAPLNAAASKQVATTQNTTPAITTQTVQTPAGMNPPHGQPGHRCDIAVGAPLNSAAGKATVQPGSAITTISSDGTVKSGSNVKITTTNNNDATPALLNAPAAVSPE